MSAMNVHEHVVCSESHEDDPHPRWQEPHCGECGERMGYTDSEADATILQGYEAATRRQWADYDDGIIADDDR